jgi:cell fate (sporulation/competence/biofilm development) regulator YlbF (YheA/YmcA/DUF963 family)
MPVNEALLKAAQDLGEALRSNQIIQVHLQEMSESDAESEAGRLKARLEALYDDLVQRQAAGEILSGGEIDQYYDLEREVKQQPALARQAKALERVQDLMTGTHDLLTNELGFSFMDLVK